MSQTLLQEQEVELRQLNAPDLNEAVSEPPNVLSKTKSSAIIITIAAVSFLNTLGSGILIVALPQIAKDLQLPNELLLWLVCFK